MHLPALRDGVLVESFGDGAVVFESVSALLHVLNPQAALVLHGCVRGWSSAGLVDDIADASGADRGVVAADVEACLVQFRQLGLLATAPDNPSGTGGTPRRTGFETLAPDGIPIPAEDHGPASQAPGNAPAQSTRRAGSGTGVGVSRSFAVIDEVVTFRSDDRELLDRVDCLFEDLVVDDVPTREWMLNVDADGACLFGPTDAVVVFPDADALVEHLPTILNEVAATSTSCLALHAGAVRSPEGEVVVFPAVSGSGKSTLTAWLVQRGWAYLSDETAAIRPGSLAVVPYPKPLVLDDVSRALLGLGPSTSANLGAAALRSGAAVRPEDQRRVGRIVLVSYQPGADTALVALEPEAAVLAVAEHGLNLRWAGPSGLEVLVELVSTVPCHRLVHGGLNDAQVALSALGGEGVRSNILLG